MAYRKSPWRKVKPSQVLPLWTTAHSNATNLAFEALMCKLGITDIPSYLRQMRGFIVISVFVCAIYGATTTYGVKGFFLGGLLGVLVPAAFLWLGTLLVGIVLYLAIYCAVWAAIWFVAMWLLHQ